jgi:hypothetical protein
MATAPRVLSTQYSRIFSDEVAAEKRARLDAYKAQLRLEPETAGTPNLTISTYYPVVGSVGVVGGFSSKSASDLLLFGTQSGSNTSNIGISSTSPSIAGCSGCANANFFALNNIYSPEVPNIVWQTTISGGTSASVVLSSDGQSVYVLSDTGKLYCLNASAGGNCSTWTTDPVSLTISGNAITPWVDSRNNAIYVANGNRGLYRINASTGSIQWGGSAYAYTTNAASRAWPIEANNILYMGDGAGYLWRIPDPTTGTADSNNATAPTGASAVQVTGGSCTASSSIDGSPSIDTTRGLVFLPYDGCIFSFTHYCASGCTNTTGSWAIKASGWTGSTPAQSIQTWPTLDGTYVYWSIAGTPVNGSATPVSALWKSSYSLSSVSGSNLVNTGGASIRSSPVVWNGQAYVGDQSGRVEEFGCASSKSSTTSFVAETNSTGTTINTPIQLDETSGDIIYGFTSDSGGGVVQFPIEQSPAASFTWNCPSGMVACDNQACGVGATNTQCVVAAACNTGACVTVASIGGTVEYGAAASEGATVSGAYSGNICPTSTSLIQGVLGASYGLPPATPDDPVSGNTFDSTSACSATDSLTETDLSCSLNSSRTCSFAANNTLFGDPCVGSSKHYYGWFACAPEQAATPVLCSRQNVVPAGTASDPCVSGVCTGTCISGWGDCDDNLQFDGCETSLTNDVGNCGACGTTCTNANGSTSCTSGACAPVCNAGYANCDGNANNGCEASTTTDPNNCGGCGIRCLGASPTCVSGVCAAPTGSCSTVASVSGASIAVGSANENGTISVSCAAGDVVQGILGASFGTPPSSDATPSSTFKFSSTCYAPASLADTQALCAPDNTNQTCSFVDSNSSMGPDPCYGTGKSYYGWFVCAPKEDAAASAPYFCSRQNLVPTGSASDPCISGSCSGTCVAGWADCDNNLQSDGCETYVGDGGACPDAG